MRSFTDRLLTYPRQKPSVSPWLLLCFAVICLSAWGIAEHYYQRFSHPKYIEMLSAARTVQSSMRVVGARKEELGLLQPPAVDPNATGLIGPELSGIMTTYGHLPSKRTVTNPDLAALFVRLISDLAPSENQRVVILTSGSFVGANVAAIAAAEALQLTPVVISSLGASMWGATDEDFTWLDIEASLYDEGVIQVRSKFAVLGGGDGVGIGMSGKGRIALRDSAERNEIPLLAPETFEELVAGAKARLFEAAEDMNDVALLMNIGGSQLGLGLCENVGDLVSGRIIAEPFTCVNGTPGLISEMAGLGVPMLHILNIRQLALEYGLPFDPAPLPSPGNNPRVYRSGPSRLNSALSD